ncbi:putative disease resistance protein RGA3 [Salvia divinorum]|uniref:Disease resistance protein RGA3 n=1 Tax=Salvia divinorum TaxID=28513 RepID=A0ABD1G1V3_SALDI
MSDAVITVILTQVATIMEKQIREELSLVCGVGHQFKKLRSEFESIQAVIADAEKRQVKEESVKVWLEKLKDVSYETEDVLSEWITAMQKTEMESDGRRSSRSRKVTSLFTMPCFGFDRVAFRREIAIKIKKINERLSDIAAEKDRYKFSEVLSNEILERPKTASFIDDAEVEGRDVDKENLIGRLLGRGSRAKGLNVVSLVGLGGVGKTTLAQLAFNCDEVVNHFNRAIWVCASDPFDEVRIARAILEFIEGSAPYLFELETLVTKIRNYVEGEKFLLVLDDVWTEDYRKWEQLLNSLKTGKAGSTILVTTRKESVARIMGSSDLLRLGGLSVVDSCTLFEKIAFFERKREGFEEVGRKIAEKCKGLPLAIKAIASLMRFKTTLKEWEDVLRSEFWELEEAEAEGLFPPLMLSYYDLPSNVKRCFTFCAFFPKDHAIEAGNLVQLWMAQGYLAASTGKLPVEVEAERVGQDYLQILAMRSFFQDVVRVRDRIVSVRMHDMVHDFAHYIAKNECSVVEFNADFQRRMESSHKRARHLTVVRAEDSRFPNVTNVEKLFTLWVQSFYDSPPIISQLDHVDPEFIRRLLSLRALDFSRNRLGELPKEIGLLIKLKHLNLSHNPFWELPETLCDLYNLQTLKLSGCDHLRRLPSKIDKLTSLRHLEIDRTSSLKMLPKGIADLASLQTLNKFIITSVNDRSNAACGLAELRSLNNLRGCLKIEGLGFAVDEAEAKKAELKNKVHLSDLEMDFSPLVKSDSQYAVIEVLEAPENLESLQITSYGGTRLPEWIMKLTKLQRIILQDCQNCEALPPLASLPLLVTLHLEGLNSMKCLDLEFLGEQANRGPTPAFPALKKLKISRMERWEKWDVSVGSAAMPRLRCLKISQCGKVKALPPLLLRGSTLRKLRIDGCPVLHRLYNKESGELWSEISHISKVRVSCSF